MPEIRSHDGDVVFCETSHKFMLKVIAGGRNRVAVTLLERSAAFFDRLFLQIIEVFVLPAFGNFRLVIKFDLIHK